MVVGHGGPTGMVLGGSMTQRLKRLTSYSKRKRSSWTHLLAQSTNGIAEGKKREVASMALVTPDLGEVEAEQGGEG